ncbi:MAG: DUF1289 domain-containing protein [Pseudomonadota bacterium]
MKLSSVDINRSPVGKFIFVERSILRLYPDPKRCQDCLLLARLFLIDLPSPCIGVCTLDPETRRCVGCLRSAGEIARWPHADESERLSILQNLRERRRAAGITSEADSRPRRRKRRA